MLASTSTEEPAIPDPQTYSHWFAAADEQRRKIAVGARRYSQVEQLTGRVPRWEDFFDPATGQLVAR